MNIDDCIACNLNRVTITLGCNHRVYCLDCFNRRERQGGNIAKCPICRSDVVTASYSRRILQNGQTRLVDCDLQSLSVMPLGTIWRGDVTTFTNDQILQQV